MDRKCIIEGCEKLSIKVGINRRGKYCAKHKGEEYRKRHPVTVRPKCTIENCNRLAKSNGYGLYKKVCGLHHVLRYGAKVALLPRKRKEFFIEIEDMSSQPCSNCGWNESYCDRHRLKSGKDGGEYVPGNVVPLCPNCHRIIHFGKPQESPSLSLVKPKMHSASPRV